MTESKSVSTILRNMEVRPETFRAMQDMNPGATVESLFMILRYCKAARLDPLRQPVVILPIDGRQVPCLSIAGLRAHGSRTGKYAGGRLEYAPESEDIDGIMLPRWAKYIVYRILEGGSRAEFEGTVFATEAVGRKRNGEITKLWRQRGLHMLGIAAERLALRRAFPESVPQSDTVPTSSCIDPETGEIHGAAPQHLSDEDIASGVLSVEAEDAGAVDADWLSGYESA